MKEVSKVKQISSYYSIISHTYSQDKYPNLKFLSARPWWLLHRLAYLRSELKGLGNLFSFTPIWSYSFPIFNPGCFPGGLIQCPLHFYSPRNLHRQNSTLLFFPKKPKLDLNSTKGIQFQLDTMLLWLLHRKALDLFPCSLDQLTTRITKNCHFLCLSHGKTHAPLTC